MLAPSLLAVALAAVPDAADAAASAPGADEAREAPPAQAPAKPPAEPAPPTAGEPLVEEIVVVAPARLPGSRSPGDGLTVTVIQSSELEASGARTLQEALQRLRGVHLADEQGNSFQQDLTFRGFTASSVTGLPQGLSVFVDGVRVNEPAAEEVNFDLIPLSDVERIEVIRGPSAVYGRNTLGGTIQVVTRRGGSRTDAGAELEASSFGSQAVRGQVGGPLGPLDGYFSVTEATERGWRVGGGAALLRPFGKLGFRRGDTDVALSYQAQVDRIEQPGSLPRSMLEQDRSQNYTAGDFYRPQLHLLTLNARSPITPALALAANGFFRALDVEQFNSSYLAPDTRLFNRTRSLGAAVQLEHQARLGPLRNRFTVGAEGTRNSVRIDVHEEPNAQFPEVDDDENPLPLLLSRLSDAQVALGAFAQEGLRVADGPLAGLGATAALRYDRISHDIVDSSPVHQGPPGSATYERWVPSLGLSWALGPHWLAAASYTEGFRAPAFLELTCAQASAPCIGLQAGVAPDPTFVRLRPVRSRGFEAGVTGSPLAWLSARASAFRTDLYDDIYSVSPAPGLVFFQNVGNTRRQGFEVALQLRSGLLDLDAAYAYTRATFESRLTLAAVRTPDGEQTVLPGAQLPMVPEHRLDAEARVRPLPWLTLSAGVGYVGSQYYRGDEANEEPKLPRYALLRAGAEARWGRWTVWLRAANLLDTRYESFGTFAHDGKVPGTPVVPFLTPGEPRRIVSGLRYEL